MKQSGGFTAQISEDNDFTAITVIFKDNSTVVEKVVDNVSGEVIYEAEDGGGD